MISESRRNEILAGELQFPNQIMSLVNPTENEEIKVKVVDTEKARAVCYEKIFGMKVILENYKGQKLFSKMRVKIKSADIVTKVIVATIM